MNDCLDTSTNFFVGWTNTLTGGLYTYTFPTYTQYVDQNSSAYFAGQIVGTVHGIAMGAAAGAASGTCAGAQWALNINRGITAVQNTGGLVNLAQNIGNGTASWSDYLALLPAAGTILGGAGAFGRWACFVYETPVAVGWNDPPVYITASEGSLSGPMQIWLISGAIVVSTSVVVSRRLKQQDEDEERTLARIPRRSPVPDLNIALPVMSMEPRMERPVPKSCWLEYVSGNVSCEPEYPVLRNSNSFWPNSVLNEADRSPLNVDLLHKEIESVKPASITNLPSRSHEDTVPESSIAKSKSNRKAGMFRPVASSALMFAGLLAGSLCFWQGMPGQTGTSTATAHATTAKSASTTRTLKTVPIGKLCPGMRVLAKNPELLREDIRERQIRPDFDRLVTFRLEKPDGSFVEWDRIESLPELVVGAFAEQLAAIPRSVITLQPVSALIPENADAAITQAAMLALLNQIEIRMPGRTIDVNLAEMGVSGSATILTIAPCPEIEPEDGTGRRLLTAVFRHSSGNIYDVQINGESSSIRCTGNHPFWSETRHQFVPACQLNNGEKLRSADMTLARVTNVDRHTISQTVFNVEVDGEHVYFVGTNGSLVHNSCTYQLRTALNTPTGGGAAHHIVAVNESYISAQGARGILADASISLDSFWNGVLLPTSQHATLHTNAYYDEVYDLLLAAKQSGGGPNAIISVLDDIRNSLLGGGL